VTAYARSPRQHLRLALLRAAGAASRKSSWPATPRAILLIRPDHLGDMLFLTPALHVLRQALPDARIALLSGPWGVEAVRDNPDLDAIETCIFPGFERRPKQDSLAPYRLLRTTAHRLRDAAYDTAVILRFDHWWGAWLAAAAGIPRRVGYDWPETRSFLTQTLSYRPDRHEVEQNATLLAALAPGMAADLGPTRYHISAADHAWAVDWLTAAGCEPGQRLVAVHPGAGAAVKQWPAASWAAVADRLAERPDTRIVLTGGPGERELVGAVAAKLARPVLNAAGATTLGQLAALYARCALVLGSDSGPLHLAVAVGTPTLHLYGPVSPTKFGPWGDPARQMVLRTTWPCAPCDRLDWPASALQQHACMGAITPDAVLHAVDSLLLTPTG
jgi:heptosyltransferase-2/heptosyltransferase-3